MKLKCNVTLIVSTVTHNDQCIQLSESTGCLVVVVVVVVVVNL